SQARLRGVEGGEGAAQVAGLEAQPGGVVGEGGGALGVAGGAGRGFEHLAGPGEVPGPMDEREGQGGGVVGRGGDETGRLVRGEGVPEGRDRVVDPAGREADAGQEAEGAGARDAGRRREGGDEALLGGGDVPGAAQGGDLVPEGPRLGAG